MIVEGGVYQTIPKLIHIVTKGGYGGVRGFVVDGVYKDGDIGTCDADIRGTYCDVEVYDMVVVWGDKGTVGVDDGDAIDAGKDAGTEDYDVDVTGVPHCCCCSTYQKVKTRQRFQQVRLGFRGGGGLWVLFLLNVIEGNREKQIHKRSSSRDHGVTKMEDLTGLDVKGRLETEFIKEIVKELSKRIRVPVRTSLPLLIGKEDAIEYVSSWLKDGSSHTVDILSIYGMGGIGKSTLAKYIYDSYCREFDTSSIVEDISRKCDGNIKGLLDLKNQLCNDISKASSIQVHDVSVASNKVLIVLDDIDSIEQLDALLGNKGFNQGSKIIITTRNMSLTERCELCKAKAEYRHKKYPLEHLCNDASLKLLCHHAFNCEELKDGYKVVSEDILKYCQGHPLALKVLGSNLYNRDLSYWESCIKELKKGPEGHVSRVNNILKMSFESLESKNDKELFKYIACLFVGMDRGFAETVLHECNLNTSTGIEHLIDRCLLRIGRNGEFHMHSLIQEMGKYVVDLESENPWERSFLWGNEDSIDVLKKKTGTRNIKGLCIGPLGSLLELETDAFCNMDNLKILILTHI
ncbi:TMV resistance protein N-like [Rutidosis leptorrhynchoides]|uniref:TMV resistance protein N-like n=1 Tax=Rutidosis leptorrhynchoides TaxID=125765 RepID=UPI003A9A46D3